tara:strand:- start:2171 stop:2722 length:552 start_codon:yes stop_codon:yes gene_type:complete
MKNSKKLIIITGPSGVGKGTVVKNILKKDKNIWLSISATTRNPREGEKDGEDYYFFSEEKFMQMIKDEMFLEWAEFAGNYYGTPLKSILEKIDNGFKVILEIEVKGACQVREKFSNALSIFLLPPNKQELEKRIRKRGTDNEEAILRRLERSDFEIKSSKDFDFTLKNYEIDKTVKEIFEIIN